VERQKRIVIDGEDFHAAPPVAGTGRLAVRCS
jgi:hypothetical protein